MRYKHLLRLMMMVVVVMLSSALSSAQTSLSATVNTDVWLRVGAGTQWRRLEVLPAGTAMNLDGRDSSATWVRGIAQNGATGWVFTQYLNISGDVNSLAVIAREAPLTVGAPGGGDGGGSTGVSVVGGTPTTANARVNIRRGPSTDYNPAGVLNFGGRFTLDGRDGAITWARGIADDGTIGWISIDFLAIGYDTLASLPIVGVNDPFGLQVSGGAAPETTAETAAPQVAAPPPVVGNTAISGFSYGGHVTGLDDNTVNYMRIAGMGWVKYQVRYDQGADPGAVAGLINDTHNKGFRILLGVVGHPWEVYNGGYNEAYAGYVAGLAALGADAIEIWNEPNLDREWPTGQIDPAAYTGLLATAYNAIKGTNPNTYVISAALAPTGAEAAFPGQVMNDNNYLAGMVNAGALNYMDCVGAHYNEGIVPPTWNSGDPRSEYYTRYYNGMVNTYWGIVGGQRPLCFTELGYLTPEGFGPLPGNFSWAANVTVADQAAWLDQVMSMARNSGRVRIVIIWNINFTQYGADPMAGYAIIRPDGNCPACFALGS